MLPSDSDSKLVVGQSPTTARQGRWGRLKRTWPGLLCLVGLLMLGLAPSTAGAARWPAPPGLAGIPKAWWSTLPGMSTGGKAAGATGGSTATTPPPASGAVAGASAGALPGTPFSGTMTDAAGSLTYLGYVPSTYQAGKAVPLVVSLHGCTQSGDDFRQLTRWDALAEAKGFIVVFPEQSTDHNRLKCWNFYQQAHMQRDAGEPSLIADITRMVQQRYTVDAHRTYVDGLSAGGAISSVMAATYPDLYAAAGIGSGCEYAATAACAGYKSADPAQAGQQAYKAMGSHARPMPVILFEGDQDTTVPPVNAQQLVQQWQTTNSLAGGGTGSSIAAQPSKVTRGQVPGGRAYTVTAYPGAQGSEMIQSWLVSGMGHAWSGGCGCQKYSDPAGPDETGAMYAFFMAHPMP